MHTLTKTGLGETFLATLGLWFCVSAASQIAGFVAVAEQMQDGGFSVAYFLPFAVSGVCGLFLVTFRRRLAVELFGEDPAVVHEGGQSSDDLKSFLIAALGIWFVATGLVDAAYIESQTLLYPAAELDESLFNSRPPRALITSEAWLSRLPYVCEILVGSALFLSSGSLTDLWSRLRNAGRSR